MYIHFIGGTSGDGKGERFVQVMSWTNVPLWVVGALGVVLILCCISAAGRFLTLRSRGTTVLIRRLPAKGIHGWRHGILMYKGEYVEFFKLRSLSPTADLVVSRQDVELSGTRQVTEDEAVFITEGHTAQLLKIKDVDYEIAFTPHGLMAFGAWVEASPSRRQERMDYHRLRERAERPRNSGHSNAKDGDSSRPHGYYT